jgi:hypothetical protein
MLAHLTLTFDIVDAATTNLWMRGMRPHIGPQMPATRALGMA